MMREKERENPPRERNNNQQWSVVSRKRTKPPQAQATRTCFINHLPSTFSISDIAKIFRSHGAILYINIPTTQKHPDYKCAFVQFYYPQSLTTAIRDEHGKRIEGSRITVFPAKQDKPVPINHHTKSSHQTPRENQPSRHNQVKYAVKDNRSYREVTQPTKPKEKINSHMNHINPHIPTQQPYPHEDFVSIPNTTNPQPSQHRIMSSRALGEHTEKIRNSLSAVEIDGEYAAALKGAPCTEITEMLQRSAVGVASSSMSSNEILNLILAEGVNGLKIKPMGGMLHLITFDTFEEKKSMMESQWLLQWFMTITNVNDHSTTLWRETWIAIYGVPLFAWGYENFHNIGSVMGRVISVEYSNYDCAKILIFTDCLFDINCKVSLKIAGESYPIFVTKEKQIWRQVSSSAQNVKITSITSDESNPTESCKGTPTYQGEASDVENFKSHNQNEKLQIDNCTFLEDSAKIVNEHIPHKNLSDSPSLTREIICTSSPNPENVNHNTIINQSQPPMHHPSVHLLSPLPETPQSRNRKKKKKTQTKPKKIRSPDKPKNTKIQSTATLKTQPPITIITHNKYGPLIRPAKSRSSSTIQSSSSSSGPLFPPGFEKFIPNHIKSAQIEKRKRRLEKKMKMKLASSIPKPSQPPPTNLHLPNSIQADDVINMANTLGLVYEGPMSELRERIDAILANQKQSWSAHQA